MCSLQKKIFKRKKKKNFRHFWFHIWEILVPSLSDSELAEMFEPVFGLKYHLLSFMNPILTFQKKNSHLVSFSKGAICNICA